MSAWIRQNRHDLETLFQITKERNSELEPDTYMMSTESGQHEARLSPEEAAAASLAATRIKLGTVGFHEYAQRTVQALESAVPETEAGMRCLAGRCSFAVGWRGDLRPCVMLGAISVPIEHNDVQAAWRAVREKSAALKQNEACVVYKRVRCAARVRHRLCARAARSARCRLMYAPTQKRSTACCARKAQRPKF